MSIKELAELIGTEHPVIDKARGTVYPARITDARLSWGKVQVQVTPVGGSGAAWIDW